MTNKEVVSSLCTSLCSAFYPDGNIVDVALFNASIQGNEDAVPMDKELAKIAIELTLGFAENSRSEGGVWVSANTKSLNSNIRRLADKYGIDASSYYLGVGIKNLTGTW